MPNNRLRPEQVAKLTITPPLPADLTDAILDSTAAEREAAAAVLLEDTRQFLEQAGVLRPTVNVLDLPYRAWAAMAAAFGTIHKTWEQPAHVGKAPRDVLKIVSTDQVAWVVGVLR